MSNTLAKNCSCPSPEIVAVPGAQGSTGAAGANGTNGVNAYTVTKADLTIPATGSTVDVGVANNSWNVIGQTVFVSDGLDLAHFKVTAIQASPPALTLKALGYNGDTVSTIVITSGAKVVSGGVQGSNGFTVLGTNNAATGGSQNLTATPAQALSVTLTLTGAAAKTYMLFARVRIDYAAATISATQVVTLTIRRTNNTGANMASSTMQTAIVTPTLSYTAGEITVMIPYTTSGVGDIIQPFVSIDSVANISAGHVNVVEASISAIELT